MRTLTGMTILLAALCEPAFADEAPDPFRVIMDAAQRSAAAGETAAQPEPDRGIFAIPKSLHIPRPEPGPPRTAMHAHEGPDGWITYECTAAHTTVEEALP